MKKAIFSIIAILFYINVFSDTANITVNNNNNLNPYSPYQAFGVNTGEWESYSNLLYPNVWQFQAAGFKLIRFPGGSNSNEYHWNGNGSYDSNSVWTVTGSPDPTSFSSGFINLSIHRGSTSVGYGHPAMVTDGNPATEWLSYPNETTPQWIYLTITAQPVNGITIDWDSNTYATQYKVQYSNGGCWNGTGQWAYNDTAWTDTSLGTVSGTGGQANLNFNTVSAQYIRVLCLSSSVPTNQYAIGEIYLYYGSTTITVNVNSVTQTASVSSSVALGDVNNSANNPANMDFEQFMSICRSMTPPAEPLITINFFTGTTQEAADWVYYANKTRGYGIKYWEIGNENWGNWEAGGPVNSQMYARRFLAFYDAMTAVDPTIMVLPQFVNVTAYENVTLDASCPVDQYSYYIEDFLNYLSGKGRLSDLQGISVHEYPGYQTATEAQELTPTSINFWDSSQGLSPLKTWMSQYGISVPIWLTEYNDGIDSAVTNHYSDSIFISSFFLDYLKNGGNYGCLFDDFGTPGPGQYTPNIYSDFGCLEGGGLSGSEDIYRYQPRSSYWSMWMLSNKFSAADALGNTLIGTTCDNPGLIVYANKRGDRKVSVILINTSTTNTTTANVTISNFSPNPAADVTTFSPQQYSWVANGTQSYANPDTQPVSSQINNVTSSGFNYSVAPYNIVLVTMYDSTQPTFTPSYTPTPGPTMTFTPTPIAYGGSMVDDCGNESTVDLWGGAWDSYGDTLGSVWSPYFFNAKTYGNVLGYQCYYSMVTGTVSSNSGAWGFGMAAPLNSSWAPTDVSSYDGIIFYYKGDGTQHRVFLDQNNIPNYDYYGIDFNSNTYWAYYMFPFENMTQASWGITGTPFTRQNIEAISFQTQNLGYSNACVAIEDVGFYKNTPTATPSVLPSATPTGIKVTIKNNVFYPGKGESFCVTVTGLNQDNLAMYIYDVAGELIKRIPLDCTENGCNACWDGTTASGKSAANDGLYLYFIKQGNKIINKGGAAIK